MDNGAGPIKTSRFMPWKGGNSPDNAKWAPSYYLMSAIRLLEAKSMECSKTRRVASS
jgi:hypothetical protein